jgi:hypothetical protein
MDEEDGRPGPQGRKFGHADVLRDVLVGSLRRSRSIPAQVPPFNRIALFSIRSPIVEPNQPNTIPALRLWRGPAEGVRLAAGGGEAP